MFVLQYLSRTEKQHLAVEAVKLAIKPHYKSGKINKEDYKEIMRKAVPKVIIGTLIQQYQKFRIE